MIHREREIDDKGQREEEEVKSLRKVRGEDIRAYVQKLVSKRKLSLL